MKNLFRRQKAALLALLIALTGFSFPVTAQAAPKTQAKAATVATGSAITTTGSAITVTKAEIVSHTSGKDSISLKISHNKSGKITGYCVYKKNSDGEWVLKLKNRKKGSFTYTDKNVSFDKTYHYRARAYYKDSDGKVHYGEYTDTLSVKLGIHSEKKYVSDKKSPVYGKTLLIYKYANGKTVEDPAKYVNIDADEYVIYVNKAKQYVTVYAIDGKYLIPVKAFICSPGAATPVGEHKILAQFRWKELMGPCWGQWCSRLTNDGIYFHSIFSSQKNSNKTMSVSAYNKLGTTCSHGCIRLQASSAKWIYDHCDVGTKVIIHEKKGYEPFTKPVIKKIPYWHTWDPTDPTAAKYCKAHKCHQKKQK